MARKIGATLLALVLAGSTGLAQTSEILKMVPGDAWGFVVVNDIGKTDKQIVKLAKRLQIPLDSSPMAAFKDYTGISKGLNLKGSAAAIVLPGDALPPLGQPRVVIVLPVTDFAQFLRGLGVQNIKQQGLNEAQFESGENVVVAARGKYALVAKKEDAVAVHKVLKAKTGIAEVAPLAKWISQTTAAAVIAPPGVQLGCQQARQAIQLVTQFANPATEQEKLGIDMAKWLANFLGDVEKNVTVVAIGGNLDKAGAMTLGVRTRFKKGGSFAKFAASVKAPPGGVLAGLPGGNFIMAGGMVYPKGTAEAMADLVSLSFTANPLFNLTDKEKKHLRDVMVKLYRMDSAAFTMNVPKKGGLMQGMYAWMHVPDAPRYLDDYAKAIKQMDKLFQNLAPGAPIPAYKIKKVKVKDMTVLELTQSFDQFAQVPGADKIFESMFGKGGKLTMSIAAVSKDRIVSAAVPAKRFPQWWAKHQPKEGKTLTDQKDVRKILASLPEGSQWVFLLSPSGTMSAAERVMQAIPQAPKLPRFPKTPPVGIGARLATTGVDMEIVVPRTVVEAIADYVRQLQNLGGAL